MKLKKLFLLIACIIAVSVVFTGCGRAHPLVGTWESERNGNILQFSRDGTGFYRHRWYSFTWEADETHVVVRPDWDTWLGTVRHRFDITGSTLITGGTGTHFSSGPWIRQ